MSRNVFQYVILVGMLLTIGQIVLERLDVVMNDFVNGLTRGVGIGLILVALFKMPRLSKKEVRD